MCPVRRCNLLGQHRLEQAQGLAELHRPALELAENSEKLLSRALLQLLTDLFGRSSTQSLTQSERCAAGEAERQGGKFCASAKCGASQRTAVACGEMPFRAVGPLGRLVAHGPHSVWLSQPQPQPG